MKRLWWRFLDRFFPRYTVGVDLVAKGSRDFSAVTVMQRKRDGTLWLKSCHHESTTGGQE